VGLKRDPTTAVVAAERSVLGACLLEPAVLADVLTEVRPDQFYRPEHGALLELFGRMADAGQAVDLLTVAERVARLGADRYGGAAYVADLPEHCPSVNGVGHHVRVVVEAHRRRRLLELGRHLVEVAEDRLTSIADGQITDTGDALEQAVVDLANLGRPGRRYSWSMGDALASMLARRGQRARLVPTGIEKLDALLGGGLRGGQLTVLGARPSTGKTALALDFALHGAREGYRIGFASLEQDHSQLVARCVSKLARIPYGQIESGNMGEQDGLFVQRWLDVLPDWPLVIYDRPRAPIGAVLAEARRWWATGGLDMLVVDYLQFVAHERHTRHDLAVGATCAALKELARDLDLPVVLLAQLNRDVEDRPAPRVPRQGEGWWTKVPWPMPSDLKDSGEIEQHADVIMFPLRADKLEVENVPPSAACIIVAKHRNGPTGVVPVAWDGRTMSYRSIEKAP
jgi:replicative DNA helicase